ncbi:MAG: polysaccharide deacetylase family protein [Candidatus Levyibacteriota bacterium]
MKREETKYFAYTKSMSHRKRKLIGISVLVICVLFLGIYLFHHTKNSSPKIVPETAKNSMKKIPADVKKVLDKQAQTASLSATYHIPILMYHYVEYIQDKKDKERQLLNVTPPVFESQIQTLLQAGYTMITAKELGDILDGKMPMPDKPIMLTFDDGHWDLDTYVVPIIKKYQVKVTAYIVPGFVGTNTDSLTQKQLQDVVDSGLVDIGAHTVHHISLKGKSLAKAQYEIGESKTMLEQQYHIHVLSFAYPYGSFDLQSLKLVQQAGFTTAASTIAGNEQNQQNRFFLFRVRPGYSTGNALLKYLNLKWKPYTFNPEAKPTEASSQAIMKPE